MEPLIIGAGLAGLSAAGALDQRGVRSRLLDKGHRPGGRCASRHFGGGLADCGPVFGTASRPDFLALAREAGGSGFLAGWPSGVAGDGEPCQPDAFGPQQSRFALSAGMNQLPAQLAKGLDIRCREEATSVAERAGAWLVTTRSGILEADALLLCLPPAQARPLLQPLAGQAVAACLALMDMVTLVPCLTVLVDLESEAPPEAPLLLPRSDSVQLISDESSKRPCSSGRLLVVQARPGWSAVHLEADSASWSRALVEEAKPSCAILRTGRVRALYPHRWRWSRLAGPGLAGPFVGRTAQGALFGMAGDAFHPAGGIEGAWRSGRALGTRLLEEKA